MTSLSQPVYRISACRPSSKYWRWSVSAKLNVGSSLIKQCCLTWQYAESETMVWKVDAVCKFRITYILSMFGGRNGAPVTLRATGAPFRHFVITKFISCHEIHFVTTKCPFRATKCTFRHHEIEISWKLNFRESYKNNVNKSYYVVTKWHFVSFQRSFCGFRQFREMGGTSLIINIHENELPAVSK